MIAVAAQTPWVGPIPALLSEIDPVVPAMVTEFFWMIPVIKAPEVPRLEAALPVTKYVPATLTVNVLMTIPVLLQATPVSVETDWFARIGTDHFTPVA